MINLRFAPFRLIGKAKPVPIVNQNVKMRPYVSGFVKRLTWFPNDVSVSSSICH